ncbi:sodium:solute symporter family protein [bacterium]|nr:sodium:solute symporter family protein [bacterium]MBU1985120.1 sodium:solute symporter family protein [bacterium]
MSLSDLSPLDYAAPALFALALLAVGWLRRRGGVAEEFLLAGRRLSAPAFVMSLVSAWYGGILGVSEYSYSYGLSNWFVFGLPYYLHAALFAIFLAKRARHSRLSSIPDKLAEVYGRRPAQLGAITIFLMTMPAAYLLMLGKLISWIFGWSYPVSLAVGTVFSTIYIYFGGLRSVTGANLVQFAMMYGGFAMMVIVLYSTFGGLDFLRANVPRELFSPLGGQSFSAVLVWYFIASTTLIEPLFYERVYAARSERLVLPGILVCILFWALFDFFTTTTGLYARALLPEGTDRALAFPQLALQVLPAGAFGLFFIALLATVVSTIDSYSFIAAAALGRDLLWRSGKREESQVPRFIRLSLVASTLCAFLVALAAESVVSVWHAVGSIGAPVLLVPTLAAWSSRHPFPRRLVLPAMLAAGLVALIWRLAPLLTDSGYWLGVQPIYIGLGISLAFYLPSLIRSPARARPSRP